MIIEGLMVPGMKLPPTRQLAEQLEVDPTAVHRALAMLVKEGLLVRTPRLGTFIAEPPGKLERMAFYHRPVASGYFSDFIGAVLNEVTRIGQQSGFVVEVFSDTRELEVSATEPLPELLREARARRVQAVISGTTSPRVVKWYNSLPVPHVTLSSAVFPNTLDWPHEKTTEKGLTQLATRGCRKIAVVTPYTVPNSTLAPAPHQSPGFHLGTIRTLRKLGLEYNPEWMIGSMDPLESINDLQMPQFGYEAIRKLWSLKNRPDGIFIYPDRIVQGAMVAFGQLGIQIPEQLKLLIHTNKEFPIFCPYPADRIVNSAKDAASALIRYVQCSLQNLPLPDRELQNYLETY